MLTPLLVRKDRGKLVLVAGHRRVAAVDLAIADGRLPADYPMPAAERDATASSRTPSRRTSTARTSTRSKRPRPSAGCATTAA
jgi:hypothetical protein